MRICVGGSNDGKRIAWEHNYPRLTMIVDEPRAFSFSCDPISTDEVTFKTEYYELERIHGADTIFSYWRHESLTVDDGLRLLFANYHTPKAKQ